MTARLANLPANMRLAFDVAPLAQERFTGIANVVYQLLCYFRSVDHDRIVPFDHAFIPDHPIVNELIEAKSGTVLKSWRDVRANRSTVYDLVASSPDEIFLGLFGSVKTVRDLFPFQAQIVYDLTVLITPECHSVGTIKHHGPAIDRDLQSNDLSICISNATRDDIVTYLGYPAHKTVVVVPGVDPPLDLSDRLRAFDERYSVEPYLIVVGTIEPRKNIPLVLELFREHPKAVAGLRAVFVGGDGWGPPFATLVREAGVQDLHASGRIQHLGYVSDFEREVLLRKAELLVFPSVYEGFGLPVLEALNVGCPVAASMSSAIPEAGGHVAYYFDPMDVESLAGALCRLRSDLGADREALRRRCIEHASRFSWQRFCREVEAALCAAAIAKIEQAGRSSQRGAARRVAEPRETLLRSFKR
jgi:glycosyltransferase involved in cell wall biosynthesis